MPVDTLTTKAQRLLRQRRITEIGEGVYNVVGDHGTYNVSIDLKGRFSCNCPGFQTKRMCSHVLAVMFLRTELKRRSKTRTIETTKKFRA
ncbi:SWIM zinc finger family protein [Candidatus Bathyarchaeota archaeon]|nr:SWIM zinc finger family protein [Candidatus Bathyarchaeota archaeon]